MVLAGCSIQLAVVNTEAESSIGFQANKIGAANGAWLESMNPLLRFSTMYCLQAWSSSAEYWHNGLKPKLWSLSSSIFKSYLQCGGRVSDVAFEKTYFKSWQWHGSFWLINSSLSSSS